MRKNILYLDTAYTISIIQTRELHQYLKSKKCGDYFDNAWVVHPFSDIPNKTEPKLEGFKVEVYNFEDGIVFIEGQSVYYKYLEKFPKLNFVISQIKLILYLRKLIFKNNISIIQTEEPYFNGLVALILKITTGRPIIVSIVANYDEIYRATGICAFPRIFKFRIIEKIIERPVLYLANLIFCVNENNQQYAVKNGGAKDKCQVVSFGRFMDRRHQIESKFREVDHGFSLNIIYLVYVGRMIELKHPDDVIRSFSIVVGKYPESILIMAGDGMMRPKLEELAKKLNIFDKVLFLGNISQTKLFSILPICSVYLSPLTGGALIEAALASLPIVAYDRDWQKDFIGENERGILVDFKDWQSMGDAAIKLIEQPDFAARIGEAAREKALYLTDLSEIYKSQTEKIEKVIGNNFHNQII